MKPVVDRLKQEYQGKVEFTIYDVDISQEGSDLMRSLGLRGVPAFVFRNGDGTEAGRLLGVVAEDQMKAQLDALK